MNGPRSVEDLALGGMASAVVLFLLLASGGLLAAWLSRTVADPQVWL